MTTTEPGATGRTGSGYDDYHASGWVTFAAVMFFIGSLLNIIAGIAAIGDSTFYTDNATFVVSGLNAWGWFLVILGVIQGLVALGLLAQSQGARWLGVVMASIGAVVALFFVSAAPFWGLGVFFLDVLIVYGLAAHGGRGRVSLT